MTSADRVVPEPKRHVVVVDYDPRWPAIFESLRATIWPIVSDVARSLEHVGSTSVPGLAAKPIIDLIVVVPSVADVRLAIDRLATIGYVHRGNLGIPEREAFHRPAGTPAHHLYVSPVGAVGLINPLALRDYLRAHPDVAAEYAQLKRTLADEHRDDVEAYTAAKTSFIVETLRLAGFSGDQLAAIERVNRRTDASLTEQPDSPNAPADTINE